MTPPLPPTTAPSEVSDRRHSLRLAPRLGLGTLVLVVAFLLSVTFPPRAIQLPDAHLEADGITLVLSGIPCDTTFDIDETAVAVLIGGRSGSAAVWGRTIGCTDDAAIPLSTPLGDRVVLDRLYQRWVQVSR